MSDKKPWAPPYLGAAYYPEDWPLEQIDEDIALMKESGVNVMRIGEFAWSRMEPREGEYDFDWLHLVVDKLAAAGIATIMGTPTPTPPAWLTERYPEVLFVGTDGKAIGHGGRRHACPNSPVYRDLCARIVTKMAEEFGDDDNIIGWQIDNEVYTHGPNRACCCPVCQRKFRDYLKERFGTIDALNDAWCLTLWSQEYQSFDQVPTPRTDVWHHPSILTAWDEFTNKSYIEFVERQADILHKLTKHPIGTDMMMIPGIDHYEINRKLDVVQYNHYHYHENFWQSAFWFDYLRPVKPDQPFWNTESGTSWSGSIATSGYSEPGFCVANSWMPIAQGGEANLYWPWRQHWAGQEILHGCVVQSSGRPMHIFEEVQEIAEGFRKAEEFLNGTKPTQSGLAIHYSNFAYHLFKNQPMKCGFNYLNTMMESIYRPLLKSQFRMDIISPEIDLSAYKVIISPFLPALDDMGLRERLKSWIEAGGIWIAGPMTDIRTLESTKFSGSPYGSLEEWGGVYCKYQIPGEPREFAVKWSDGTESTGGIWYDGLELKGAEALATYTEGPIAGLAAAARQKMGKGWVITLATLPTQEDFLKLVKSVCAEAGITPVAEASENLLVVPRSGAAGEGMVVVEFENKPASITLTREATDILTGEKLSGNVEVKPYGVRVLKY